MGLRIGFIVGAIGMLGLSRAHAGCGQEKVLGQDTYYCESSVTFAGVGANGSPGWTEGVVYLVLADNGAWFWDNSSAKNMVLATLLTAKSTGQRVQIRYVDANQGIGTKRITSALLIPD